MQFPPTTASLDLLPNGLSLILAPDPRTPVVSSQLWVESGSIHEDHLTGAGISHFLEHMVFKGAGRFGASELATSVQAAGGHWNAYTSFDRTVYYIDGPAAGLDPFLEVLAAMVFQPHLPESEFDKEKDVIRREIDMGLDDPDDVASRLMFSTAFVRDARAHPVIGHRHLFDAISYEDLQSYHQRRYTPDRCCLCIGGDFDPEALRSRIDALFASVPRGNGNEPLVIGDPAQLGPRRSRRTFDVPSSRISLAWKIPALGHPDIPALDLAAAILGRGRSARLYRKLREDRGLALEISAWSWSQAGCASLFGISAEADVAQRDELIDAIRKQLSQFPDTSFEDDLAKAKRQITAAQFRSLTTASGRTTDLASNWHEARDLDYTRHYLAELDKVVPEDIRRACSHFTDAGESLVILDPEGSSAPSALQPKPITRPEPETFQLPNGTTVALLPDPAVPIISLQSATRGGVISETSADAGLSRLLAATLPQGTLHRDAASIALTMESLGASIGANSGNNSTQLQLAGLTPDLSTLIPLFSEIFREPALTSDSIDRERNSQLAALQESLEDPLSLAFRLLRQHLFGETGYGVPAMGTLESLPTLDREALSNHHARRFSGRNTTLALAGDFEPALAKELIQTHFDALPGGTPWQATPSTILPATDHLAHLPKKQAVLAIGYPGCAALADERFALRMIQEWCSDMAGPLFTRIREDLGLAYQVGATQFHGHDTGLFAFYMATDPSQIALAEKELLSEIGKIAGQGIPTEAFERVRSTVLSAVALGQQAPGAIARHAAIDLLFGLPATHHRDVATIFAALTPDEVKAAAATLLSSRSPTIIRVMPKEP